VTSKSQDTFAKAGKTKVTTNGAVKQTADAPTAALTTKTAPQVASKSAQQALADPKVRAQIAEMRTRIHSTLGQVVLAMAALPRYRYLSLVDLQAIVLEPLIRDRLVVATQKKDDDAASLENGPLEIGALDSVAGIAIWASVSTEVDARIRDQVKARVFPVKLKPEDWTSGSKEAGDHAWLLDVIAPTPKLASMVLASFSRLVKTGELNVHPVAARQVDADMLRKLARDRAVVGASTKPL
jgi:cytolysin-activating lysine-acyltransferase